MEDLWEGGGELQKAESKKDVVRGPAMGGGLAGPLEGAGVHCC